ncbi:MAG: hypothetical protein HY722_12470 [Planctomycetes bacterium]|nr:hypothetical protein [Planctomycetota bacterium]
MPDESQKGPPGGVPGEEERIFFGDLVRAMGYATAEQILECLNVQRREDERGLPHRRVGEILVERGYLRPAQLSELLDMI